MIFKESCSATDSTRRFAVYTAVHLIDLIMDHMAFQFIQKLMSGKYLMFCAGKLLGGAKSIRLLSVNGR